MTMRITPGELEATNVKIEKINARAAKRGFTGQLTIEAQRVEVTETNALGLETVSIFYDVQITGEPPKYAGWTFLAELAWDEEAGLIVRSAPGVEKVNRDGLREGWCDHCKIDRYRAKTYLVGNDRGETVQVGSTCTKDFLGWTGRPVFYSADEVSSEVEEFLGRGGYTESRWPVSTVLAASWAAIQVHGYQPASSFGNTTKDTVRLILDPRTKWAREEVAKFKPYVEQSAAQAKIVRDWILSDEFSGDNDYVINLKLIAGAETCGPRNVGLLASAPQTWAKAQARDLIRRKEQAEIVNEFIGAKGDKVEVTVRIKSFTPIEGQFGATMLYLLVGEDKHIYKWFSSAAALGATADDTAYRLRGTVKGHEEYNGLKSTVLTRCKILSTTEKN